MGLLDDAIREHLDLKRRRGADPAEVARLEHEALGPVRREPAPVEAPPAEPRDEHPAPDQGEEHEHAADSPHVLAPEERHDPPHGDPLFEHHEDPVLQPTTEYHVEDHHDDEDKPEPERGAAHSDDDVLEETPEFLQETPEHDRLWFEQRPPRDFDFDG
ncbi:MAG TPA: hypothetical protein VN635_10460 [Conexibacter sp.]|nr:hypothetical protein [Conexibacter sp.]